MSELYRHLLIPPNPEHVPKTHQIIDFFDELAITGALPMETKFATITFPGGSRPFGSNPETGDIHYVPNIKVNRFADLQSAADFIQGMKSFTLCATGTGPVEVPPFELYSADNYGARTPGELWRQPFELSVRCQVREKIRHFLHSPGCDCELKLEEPAIFENPWNGDPIQTGAPACARFWIEFGVGDYLMPKVTDTLDILDPRLMGIARQTFGFDFCPGCIRNDD